MINAIWQLTMLRDELRGLVDDRPDVRRGQNDADGLGLSRELLDRQQLFGRREMGLDLTHGHQLSGSSVMDLSRSHNGVGCHDCRAKTPVRACKRERWRHRCRKERQAKIATLSCTLAVLAWTHSHVDGLVAPAAPRDIVHGPWLAHP